MIHTRRGGNQLDEVNRLLFNHLINEVDKDEGAIEEEEPLVGCQVVPNEEGARAEQPEPLLAEEDQMKKKQEQNNQSLY
jgi:hypothetical protein